MPPTKNLEEVEKSLREFCVEVEQLEENMRLFKRVIKALLPHVFTVGDNSYSCRLCYYASQRDQTLEHRSDCPCNVALKVDQIWPG